MVDPRFSTANRDMGFLQEQNTELKTALLEQSEYAEQKDQELKACQDKLATLEKEYARQSRELQRVRVLYLKMSGIDTEQDPY